MYFHHDENFPEKLQITKFIVSLHSGYCQMIIEDEAELFADAYNVFSQNWDIKSGHHSASCRRNHRPYSRQVTEWMKCDVVMHPPHTVYPKDGNGAFGDQWAIKYHCQNDSSTIAFIVRDLVHWNYVSSENITHVCTSWKSLINHINLCFCNLHFFVHQTLTPLQLTSGELRSGRKHWPLYELERGNCNYCHPNMGVGKSNCTDNGLLKNVNMMVQ